MGHGRRFPRRVCGPPWKIVRAGRRTGGFLWALRWGVGACEGLLPFDHYSRKRCPVLWPIGRTRLGEGRVNWTGLELRKHVFLYGRAGDHGPLDLQHPLSSSPQPVPHRATTRTMLSRKPRLRTRRPSPTTVEYTLTTKPAPTLPTALLHLAIFLLRLLLLAAAALLPLTHLGHHIPSLTLHALLSTPALDAPSRIPFPAALALAAALAYVSLRRIHSTESVLALRGLGLQTRSSTSTWGSGDATRFIPTEKIRDVLVNEAFVGFGVRYVLVVVVEGEEDMVVVFPRLGGGKEVVLRVWRGLRACLFEGGG